MEAALILRHIEEGQLLHLFIGVIVDAALPDGPVTCTHTAVFIDLLAAFLQILPEFHRCLRREDSGQSVANRVQLVLPQRVVFLEGGSLEVHKDTVFGNGAGHQLTVATQNVAAIGFHQHAVTLQAIGHLRPILFLGGHDVEGLAYHGKTNHRQHQGDGHVTGHYFFVAELTHSGTSII